jgi:DNA sulfur modification protein DndD
MLWLRRLEVTGFGPFVAKQTIDFPDKPGVVVVYGENMRGKSSLVDAVRYALFGTLYARGQRQRRRLTVSNRELAAAGQYGFEVALTFLHDDEEYQLVRRSDPRVEHPRSDDDFVDKVLVRRGPVTLGPQECQHLLAQVLPEDVSRFFLFDGELLQQYEDLLSNESETGRRISEAIERILGVPILRNGRAHLNELASQAERVAAKEASKHLESQALGTALELATEQRDAHVVELERLEGQEKELVAQRAEVEDFLSTRSRYSDALDDLKRVESRLGDSRSEERSKRLELKEAMAESWRTLLAPTAVAARKKIQAEAEHEWASLQLSLRRKAIDDEHCGTCDQDVPEVVRVRLKATLTGNDDGDGQRMGWAMARLSELNRYRDFDNGPLIREIWARIEQLRIEQVGLADQASELRHELEESDPEALTHMKATLGDVTQKIAVVRQGMENERREIAECEIRITRLREKIEKLGLPAMKESQRRAKLLRDASEVLAGAVERYKEQLRARVEASASALFLSMTTEKIDYVRLSINERYGLNIIHRDGQAEEARSAGAEHVVALALMGALHANAPLHGPIVMDSPFGRLDDQHTRNVVTTLPQMADQVVVLVFESEVGRDQMRGLLGSQLLREYELVKHSARNSEIVEIR